MTSFRDFMPADRTEEELRRMVRELEDEALRREDTQRRLKALSLIATASMMVPGGAAALLPPPKRFDCPQCGRAKLQRSSTMIYCLRCSYVEKR